MLKALRKNLRLTQAEMAERLGVSHKDYSAMERGRLYIPVHIKERICNFSPVEAVLQKEAIAQNFDRKETQLVDNKGDSGFTNVNIKRRPGRPRRVVATQNGLFSQVVDNKEDTGNEGFSQVVDSKQDADRLKKSRTLRGFEHQWWLKKNKKCLSCSKACKQSSFVRLIYCPSYERAL